MRRRPIRRRCYHGRMRAALPFILVALALFTACCIAYIAWDLTSSGGLGDDPSGGKPPDDDAV